MSPSFSHLTSQNKPSETSDLSVSPSEPEPAPIIPNPVTAESVSLESSQQNKQQSSIGIYIVIGLTLLIITVISIGSFFLFRNKDVVSSDPSHTTSPSSDNVRDSSGAVPPGDSTAIAVSSTPSTHATNNTLCDQEYQKLMAKYGKNYDDCIGTIYGAQQDTLKEVTNNVVIILDSSGSMAAKIGSKSKMEIAKEAVLSSIDSLGENADISLVVYGHKGGNSQGQKAESCAGIEEVYTLGSLHRGTFDARVTQLKPTGWTPIAGSLDVVSKLLQPYATDQYLNTVILVSDGQETCGGSPTVTAQKLHDSNIKLIVNVIGFDVRGADESQLKDIARSGGGNYYPAQNAQTLQKALTESKNDISKTLAESHSHISTTTNNSKCALRLSQERSLVNRQFLTGGFISSECREYVRSLTEPYFDDLSRQIETENAAQKKQIDNTFNDR